MNNERSERTTAERITFFISLGLLAAILGLAGWASLSGGDTPPTITVEADLQQVRELDAVWYLPITITNTGSRTAQSVTVSGELATDEGEPETAEVSIDFLAGGESEQAELVFTTDPASGDLTLAPVSFLYP